MMSKRLIFFFLLSLVFLFACRSSRYSVASDGSGNYRSIQAALDAVPIQHTKTIVVDIKPGIYQEKVILDARKHHILLRGNSYSNTIITGNLHAGMPLPNGDTVNTWTSATTLIYGNDIRVERIGFRNDAGFTAGQATALRVEGNRVSFFNCAMTGFQDVLFLSGSGVKHYFNHCYIEGTTDFIFGAATAVFDSCHIHSKKNSHVTAASTNSIIPYGFVFRNCNLTADSTINKVSLGRPWSPNASVTYLNCYLGAHIIAEGWNNWKNPANELTARYAEYHSYGPGATLDKRVKWSRQLTDVEASAFTLNNILGAWNPWQ